MKEEKRKDDQLREKRQELAKAYSIRSRLNASPKACEAKETRAAAESLSP